jgi:hydroxyacylglutathione hydrolase
MLHLDHLPTGPLGVNCSLIWDPGTGTGVVVDPGGNADRIRRLADTHAFRIAAVLLTHAHFDHLGAAAALQASCQVPVHLHPADQPLLSNLASQVESFGMDPIAEPLTTDLVDGQVLHGLTVIHTPGHSPGGCCFFGKGTRGPILAAGDTLFAGGVGRTDLWGGDFNQLERSIRTRLFTLPDETRVVPGHGPDTTVGQEAATNPFVHR